MFLKLNECMLGFFFAIFLMLLLYHRGLAWISRFIFTPILTIFRCHSDEMILSD